MAHLGGAAPGAAKSSGDKLWEDNWDDDDIEDDFSVQLRCVSLCLLYFGLSSILMRSFSVSVGANWRRQNPILLWRHDSPHRLLS